jgi:hypothetical protein
MRILWDKENDCITARTNCLKFHLMSISQVLESNGKKSEKFIFYDFFY